MPQLVNGIWETGDVAASEMKDGAFRREETRFRGWITPDGAPGPDGQPGFAAEPGRYHLYVAYICPWASRTLMMRTLKGLDGAVGVTAANPALGDDGWSYLDADGASRDTLNGISYLHQLYVKAKPDYTGKVSVPALWDLETGTIVNNESSEIIRMLNSGFAGVAGNGLDFYPAALRGEIDRWNDAIYESVNNGVYKAGFARSAKAYEAAFDALFATLDRLEAHLSTSRYLAGDFLTEADIRLFVTLIRFDAAYVGAFKCNLRRIADYPALSGYTRELYQWPGIAATVKLADIKAGYYSIRHINPNGIVPKGPALDFSAAHGRDGLAGKGVWGG